MHIRQRQRAEVTQSHSSLQETALPETHGRIERLADLRKIPAGPQAAGHKTGISAAMLETQSTQIACSVCISAAGGGDIDDADLSHSKRGIETRRVRIAGEIFSMTLQGDGVGHAAAIAELTQHR